MSQVSNGPTASSDMTGDYGRSTPEPSSTFPSEADGGSYFSLERRRHPTSATSTPSPGTRPNGSVNAHVLSAANLSGSESESWQDVDSDTDGKAANKPAGRQIKSKLSNVVGSGDEESSSDNRATRNTRFVDATEDDRRSNSTVRKKKNNKLYKAAKKTSPKFRLKENNVKSKTVDVNGKKESPSPSFLSNVLRSSSYTTPSPKSSLEPEASSSGYSGGRRLKKARSKSDAGMHSFTYGEMLKNRRSKKNGYSKSEDLRNGDNQPCDDDDDENAEPDGVLAEPGTIHSDTDLQNQGPENMPKRQNSTKRRFLYNRTNTMGDLFHSSDSPSALFKRRISALNNNETPSNAAWKDFKNTLRMNFGIKKRRDQNVPQIDYDKSTELITELSAGAPAAIVFAASFQRDEKNLRRIPVLLEQIKFKLTDTSESPRVKNRKYRLDLEYGSGPARLTWTIYKEYKEFWMLHNRLKSLSFQSANPFAEKSNLPKFPTKHRSKTAVHSTMSNPGSYRPTPSTSHPDLSARRSITDGASPQQNALAPTTSLFSISSQSTASHHTGRFLTPFHSRTEQENQAAMEYKAKLYEELSKDMERYLKSLFQQFRFRPDANKIFQFLEISNMSIRLAPENSFHGKEGYLIIRSSSTLQGWRVSHWRPNDITQMINRHTHKWFMVRHSYIVCVENIFETNILEVFMVDSSFNVTQRSITGDVANADNDDTRSIQTAPVTPTQGKPGSGTGGQVHITLQLENNERKIKLVTGSEKNLQLWLDSINEMKEKTEWSKKQRFDSFAPIRRNAHAQWFVDGVSEINSCMLTCWLTGF